MGMFSLLTEVEVTWANKFVKTPKTSMLVYKLYFNKMD